MSKHTPGPWKLVNESRHHTGSELLVTDSEGGAVIAEYRMGWNDYETACANARLGRAAPELFSQLKSLYRWYCGTVQDMEGTDTCSSATLDGLSVDWNAIRAAIRKAEGK